MSDETTSYNHRIDQIAPERIDEAYAVVMRAVDEDECDDLDMRIDADRATISGFLVGMPTGAMYVRQHAERLSSLLADAGISARVRVFSDPVEGEPASGTTVEDGHFFTAACNEHGEPMLRAADVQNALETGGETAVRALLSNLGSFLA